MRYAVPDRFDLRDPAGGFIDLLTAQADTRTQATPAVLISQGKHDQPGSTSIVVAGPLMAAAEALATGPPAG